MCVLCRLAAAFGILLMGLVAQSAAADTLKYGLVNPPTHISVDMVKKFNELLVARTSGKVAVEAFPAQQLVRSDNWFQGVRLGTVDFASGAISLMEGLTPEITILDAPYLFKDLDHARRVLDGDFTQKLNDKLTKSGVRILAWWLFGVRHLATTIPVKTPGDLVGKKIRDVPSPVLLATLEGMGASPVPLDWGEVYTALQTGAVAGIVNPPDILFNAGLFEVLKYLALTGHTTMVQAIVMNERKFQNFSPDVQAAIQESAKLAADWQWQSAIDQEKDFIEKLRSKGMTIVTEANGLKVSEFAAKAHPFVVNKYMSQWSKAVYDQITDVGKKQ